MVEQDSNDLNPLYEWKQEVWHLVLSYFEMLHQNIMTWCDPGITFSMTYICGCNNVQDYWTLIFQVIQLHTTLIYLVYQSQNIEGDIHCKYAWRVNNRLEMRISKSLRQTAFANDRKMQIIEMYFQSIHSQNEIMSRAFVSIANEENSFREDEDRNRLSKHNRWDMKSLLSIFRSLFRWIRLIDRLGQMIINRTYSTNIAIWGNYTLFASAHMISTRWWTVFVNRIKWSLWILKCDDIYWNCDDIVRATDDCASSGQRRFSFVFRQWGLHFIPNCPPENCRACTL
jgi:hypothetical protein